jgi:hypothetical protein
VKTALNAGVVVVVGAGNEGWRAMVGGSDRSDHAAYSESMPMAAHSHPSRADV